MSIEAFKKSRRRLLEEIFKQREYQEVRASGRFERFVKDDNSAKIQPDRWVQYGTPYTPYMDAGRGKTRNRTGGLVEALYEWLQYKKYGLQWRTDKERRGMAYAIAKNMSKLGSYKRRRPDKRTTIIETALKHTVPFMLEELGKERTSNVESEVQAQIKKY